MSSTDESTVEETAMYSQEILTPCSLKRKAEEDHNVVPETEPNEEITAFLMCRGRNVSKIGEKDSDVLDVNVVAETNE